MICPGCKNEIDETVCWCGDLYEHHKFCSDHSFVPMGCDCGRIKVDEIPKDGILEHEAKD